MVASHQTDLATDLRLVLGRLVLASVDVGAAKSAAIGVAVATQTPVRLAKVGLRGIVNLNSFET